VQDSSESVERDYYLRLWKIKIVLQRVTVVKFGVNNRGSDGTGCFRKKSR